ncbi:hypothetical protein BJV85_000193 [Clostridium acetobutylicum]|uniref:Uncharacterized protein, homolog of Bacillus firmus (Gi:2654481) n=1 Tax=Clostridium acetobutylicum (strain ATCC 824 / DSM 792 / JCM 1419 / IAM 19013 / LMG 5710 / NBRC 13948 / NRRL B-527 / VKM B-1787 / 2291 / W) TaxID=272562 RepID=Q97CY3_CLOAB|nr:MULTISPECIES: DUF4176 domain-containing protein [Clostridium]AAK81627.1 Uncharacterized protein, homolog of Bacillus firmus (gi:2654481) [Clostridium acetobutylicum ATCC 824]ADZ20687.1 Conserved hypothetical protein [Clostridium acetobutylicum EA 2018]ADZ22751.1 Conserved hypothetical protein [Clostridium acetobutylicum EA 2018]AEI33006.1 hypothetical protein SMB_G3750 [Clostridium acetobutylicum DSM 1731]AWV80698.1 DUF4176 domain-containing protein [Clostridium acetobutylicum]
MMEEKSFLPLGSIVILKGAIKKLMIVSRANVVNNNYFDYGAILYPEGMIDENVAYFNGKDILKVVSEAYTDDDDALMVEQLCQAKEEYLASSVEIKENVSAPETAAAEEGNFDDDPFAAVRDMEDDDE